MPVEYSFQAVISTRSKRTGVLGEVGSSKLDCFLELERPRALEFARFRFKALEDPERLSDLSNEPSPPSPSPCDSFFVIEGTSSFSYDEQL